MNMRAVRQLFRCKRAESDRWVMNKKLLLFYLLAMMKKRKVYQTVLARLVLHDQIQFYLIVSKSEIASTKIKPLSSRKASIKNGSRGSLLWRQCSLASKTSRLGLSKKIRLSWRLAPKSSRNVWRRTIFKYILSECRLLLSSLKRLWAIKVWCNSCLGCSEPLLWGLRTQTLESAKNQ